MTGYRKLFSLVLLGLLSLAAGAQPNGCNSSYSRFGLGLVEDPATGFNRAMGGVGFGIRMGNRLNPTNPASYSAIDSVSLIMDVGMKGSFGKFKQGGKTVGVNNASLDYVHFGMHIARRLGLVAGFMPYTTIGYSYSSPDNPIATDANTTQQITSSNAYNGSGGLSLAYIGLGWRPWRNLSVGANIGFLWGDYSHGIIPVYKEAGVESATYSGSLKSTYAQLRTFKLDLGAQYPVRLTAEDWLTVGAVVGVGHKIPQDVDQLYLTSKGDTTTYVARQPFDLPWSVGGGLAWQHRNTLLVAADVRLDMWNKCRTPIEYDEAGVHKYEPLEGYYKNRTKIGVGAQWTPNPYKKQYWNRVQYRAGVSYATSYMKIDGNDGPRELTLSIGAGLPITNNINNRSVVNVGMQWLRRSPSVAQHVKEDYLVVTLGLTFNEHWFFKRKIE